MGEGEREGEGVTLGLRLHKEETEGEKLELCVGALGEAVARAALGVACIAGEGEDSQEALPTPTPAVEVAQSVEGGDTVAFEVREAVGVTVPVPEKERRLEGELFSMGLGVPVALLLPPRPPPLEEEGVSEATAGLGLPVPLLHLVDVVLGVGTSGDVEGLPEPLGVVEGEAVEDWEGWALLAVTLGVDELLGVAVAS